MQPLASFTGLALGVINCLQSIEEWPDERAEQRDPFGSVRSKTGSRAESEGSCT